MKKFLFLAAALLLFSSIAQAQTIDVQQGSDKTVYFFWNHGCPYCVKEKAFLGEVEQKYPGVRVERINISENQALFEATCKKYDTIAYAWPRTFIGSRAFVGFAEECTESAEYEYNPAYKAYVGYKNHLERAIEEEFDVTPEDGTCEPEPPAQVPWQIFLLIPIYLLSYFPLKKRLSKRAWLAGLLAVILLSAFAFAVLAPKQAIRAFASGMPFPVFVLIVALLDGFNPCAFTVLAVLLSLLTYTKSKRKMALIGGTFIITSGIMYFIFIMALLLVGSVFFSQFGLLVLRVLGAVIVAAGIINVKDFFFFKKGVSLSISQEKQKTIYGKARAIVEGIEKASSKKAMALALLATIALAVFVNMVELGCSAILPAAYMASLLQTYGEAVGAVHIFYTAMYSLVYIVPLFAILFNFIYLFKSERVNEKQGRMLKLLGGLIMLSLGIVMLFKPELLIFA